MIDNAVDADQVRRWLPGVGPTRGGRCGMNGGTRRVLRGTLVSDGRRQPDAVVVLDGDRIADVAPAAAWTGPPASLPPPSSALLLPGLVDGHNHGGAGHGFPDADGDADGVRRAARHHRDHGTTTLLAGLVSAPAHVLRARLATLAAAVADGTVAGVHLEGPFLSPSRPGAHDPTAILPGDPALLDDLLAAAGGTVATVTVAPETPRFDELVRVLARHRVTVALGHTDATARRTSAAIETAADATGAPVVATHLFNAMPPLHHRAPGPVAACLRAAARGRMVVELIADGVHLADDTVATVVDLVGPGQVALVTDATAAAGMPDGEHRLGTTAVRVVGGVARLADAAALAGGTARLLDVVRRVVDHAGVEPAAAVEAATRTPARLLGLDHEVGSLSPGFRADVLVTDADLHAVEVIRAGRTVVRHAGRLP